MISKDKTYRTRDGREVRIYATDGAGLHVVQGAVKETYGWVSHTWDENGITYRDDKSNFDIIEVKPRHKRTMWLNVYDNEVISLFISKEKADSLALTGRIACIKIDLDFEEGEGLTHSTYSIGSGGGSGRVKTGGGSIRGHITIPAGGAKGWAGEAK